MHFTCTVYCCVFYNSVTNLNAEHNTAMTCTEVNIFLKTRCKIACPRNWLNCRSLAAAVHPSTISDHPCYLPCCDTQFQNWSELALKKEVKVKVLSHPILPEFRHSTAAWKVPMLRPLVLLVKETCTWGVRSIGRMTLIGYNRNTRRNPCSTATLPPQISNRLVWDLTRTSTLKWLRITAWAMERPVKDRLNWTVLKY